MSQLFFRLNLRPDFSMKHDDSFDNCQALVQVRVPVRSKDLGLTLKSPEYKGQTQVYP